MPTTGIIEGPGSTWYCGPDFPASGPAAQNAFPGVHPGQLAFWQTTDFLDTVPSSLYLSPNLFPDQTRPIYAVDAPYTYANQPALTKMNTSGIRRTDRYWPMTNAIYANQSSRPLGPPGQFVVPIAYDFANGKILNASGPAPTPADNAALSAYNAILAAIGSPDYRDVAISTYYQLTAKNGTRAACLASVYHPVNATYDDYYLVVDLLENGVQVQIIQSALGQAGDYTPPALQQILGAFTNGSMIAVLNWQTDINGETTYLGMNYSSDLVNWLSSASVPFNPAVTNGASFYGEVVNLLPGTLPGRFGILRELIDTPALYEGKIWTVDLIDGSINLLVDYGSQLLCGYPPATNRYVQFAGNAQYGDFSQFYMPDTVISYNSIDCLNNQSTINEWYCGVLSFDDPAISRLSFAQCDNFVLTRKQLDFFARLGLTRKITGA